MKKTLQGKNIYGIVFHAFVFAFLAVLYVYARITTLSADDYWYSTFLRNGVSAWFKMMQNHYETINGRNIVHLLAAVILHFGNTAFAIVFIASFIAIGLCLCSGADRTIACSAFFLSGVILMPRPIMVEGCLWISAFCNYVFPTVLISFLFRRSRRLLSQGIDRRRELLLPLALSLLCGATTEQSGIAAGVLLLFILSEALRNRNFRYARVCFVQIILVLLGLISIFCSPATQQRMDTETTAPLIGRVTSALLLQRTLWGSCRELVVLAIVIPFLIFAAHRERRERIVIALISLPIEACIFIMLRRDSVLGAYCYGGLLVLYFLLSATCWIMQDTVTGSLLGCAVVTAGVMLFTTSSSFRSLVPMYILFLAVTCRLVCKALNGLPGRWTRTANVLILVLLAAIVSVRTVRDLPHYQYNFRLDARNQAYARQARTSGVHYYCIDYDEDYTHTKAYHDGYFFTKYLESANPSSAPEQIYLYSDHLPIVFVDGSRITSPALTDSSGQWLIPLRDVVEQAGGSVNWSDEAGTTVIWNETVYSLTRTVHGYTVSGNDGEAERCAEFAVDLPHNYYLTMLPIRFFTDLLGLHAEISDSVIYVTGGDTVQ